ncbi:bifunctional folylpolyglutamate synthase/dihydrofolate synthase [Leptothermofonsia sp. ETS-13]|uniref:bifunctional folylpolyglutamate synthase/dihydrofolate synthase n=1 Tax=Leptothermofonsia sp. ETS-13 TaxID=3035696 RepID=UPI003B9E6734
MVDIDSILQKFERFGVRLGLESIQQLLAELENPHERVSIVHVAGSNGKGSVCAYLSAVLTEAGYRVGRYTSPHLVSWCERICLNEQPITPDELENVLNQVITAIPSGKPSPTQFEVITAAAWLYFAQQKVDIAVVEVGLGGRLDATNVCDRPPGQYHHLYQPGTLAAPWPHPGRHRQRKSWHLETGVSCRDWATSPRS